MGWVIYRGNYFFGGGGWMKFNSFRLYKVAILTLAIATSSVFAESAKNTTSYNEQKRCEFIQHVIQYLHNLGHEISDIFHDIFCSSHKKNKFNYDLTLVGFVNFADGIGRHPILFKECLEDKKININFVSTRNIPPDVEDAQLGLPRLDPNKKEDIGAIAILTDILADKAVDPYKKMPDSIIKVAYTMFESTAIPYNWAAILNKKFDMAVVPDAFLVDVYKNCGVQIPIFVLPLPLMLNEFLDMKKPTAAHKPFVFGFSGGFWPRKNHIRILEAFAAEFGNCKDVKLRIHGRFGEEEIIQALAKKIADDGLTNVELIVKPYNWDDYLEFFKSLDCGVCLSMGEGFSITPREILACGKPCIVTNNTAQGTICESGTVRVVASDILVPAIYDCHYDANYITDLLLDCTKNFLQLSACIGLTESDGDAELDLMLRSAAIGYQFDCTVQDARDAMRDVYQNYKSYLKKAGEGRKWVKQYLRKNLSKQYISLVRPDSIVLGEKNVIGDNFLMTNSKDLYDKYRFILENK